MVKHLTKMIAENAIIAALYCAVTILCAPLSYGGIQLRFAEILVLLCFYRPDFCLGLTLGCFLANIGSTLGPWDMLFGTLATCLSVVLVSYASPRLFIACLYPIVINAFVVGGELYYLLGEAFWLQTGFVAAGEAIVIAVGYVIWILMARNKGFMRFLEPTRHQSIKY